MINQCPHCHQSLNLSHQQIEKLEIALFKIEPGKALTFKCPLCRKNISLDKALMATPQAAAGTIQPPPPPNIDWLKTGVYRGEEKVEDVPMALVLHKAGDQRKRVADALKEVGYQVSIVNTVAEALDRMRFVNFTAVSFDATMEGTLESSNFHNHMRAMPMERRRYIFYILIGPGMHTLYQLEALAYSANATVNTQDLRYLDVVLRKSIPDYEELFGPFLEELGIYGQG